MNKKQHITLENDLRERLKDPEFQREWSKPDPDAAILEAIINARRHAKLSQRALAKKMQTSQAIINRVESGENITLKTLKKLAKATDTTLKIEFLS